MPATYRSSTHSSFVSGVSEVTLNKPAGLAVGDIMVAVVHHEYSSVQYPSCSGWTLEKEQISTIATVNQVMAILWKRATASDVSASSFTFDWTNASDVTADLHAFSGCAPSGNPFAGDTIVAGGGSGTIASVSYTAGNGLGVWIYTAVANGSTIAIPSGYTSRTASSDGDLQLATRTDTAGATSSGTGSTSDTTNPGVTFVATLLDPPSTVHAATYANNAEGGTNAVTVTPGNSGGSSGTAWSNVSIGSGATATYSNAPAKGTLAYRFSVGVTPAQSFVNWEFFPESPTVYIRFNFFVPAYPAVTTRLCDIQDGTSIVFRAAVRNDGRLLLDDSVNAQMALSALPLPVNRWVRVELKLDAHPTTGQVAYRLFMESDSPYPAEQGASTATFNTRPAGNPREASFGIRGSASNVLWYLDDIAISNASYPGPADGSAPQPLLRQNNAEMGADGVEVTQLNTGDSANHFFEAFDSAGSIAFSNAQSSHGSLSYRVQPTSGAVSAFSWMSLGTSSAAVRVYAYFTSLPPSSTEFVQFRTAPNGTYVPIAGISLRSAGNISFTDSTSAIVWTSAATISLNTWYRFELKATIGGTATTGSLEGAYYALDSTTAIDSFSSSAITLGTENFSLVRFGKLNTSTWADVFYLDGVAVTQAASALIGPYTAPVTPAVYDGLAPSRGWGADLAAPSAADRDGVSFLSTAVSTANQSSYTFTNQPLGMSDETRVIIVGIAATSPGTELEVDTVTIAGISATIDVTQRDFRLCALARAEVPTGTVGDIVVNFVGGTMSNAGISVWRICGGAVSPIDEARAVGASADLTVTGAANGCVIAISLARFPVPAYGSWSGVNERFNRVVELSANVYFMGGDCPTAGGSVPISATWTGGSVDRRGVSVAYQIT